MAFFITESDVRYTIEPINLTKQNLISTNGYVPFAKFLNAGEKNIYIYST